MQYEGPWGQKDVMVSVKHNAFTLGALMKRCDDDPDFQARIAMLAQQVRDLHSDMVLRWQPPIEDGE